MLPESDELKDRLQRLERLARPARKRRARRIDALDDLEGVIARDHVLVIERDAMDLMSGDALSRLTERTRRARRAIENREDLDDGLRTLLARPEGALFIDTETTGLGSAMVFLLGVMSVSDEGVVLRQVFARDYREENALLGEWTGMLGSAEMLVSFNGKSFDMPVLRDRLGFHGMQSPVEPRHVDLLHPSRRRWRGVLPDCRLQTLEWQVCGRRRSGDIPGEEIPAAYHHFVRTGDPADMLSVLHHNALDLITLADIAAALALPDESPRP
ncbi:MAG: hypothetical protein GF400_05890 [Candidatus Eisenbacteria bacterium]|nr:hypothetical protein [Candidatus Eisenbacteria bacterium]